MLAAARGFVPVMVNCTAPGLTDVESFAVSAETRPLMDAFGVTGWPTILVAAPNGAVLRRWSFLPPDMLRARLESAAERWERLAPAFDVTERLAAELRTVDPAARDAARDDLVATESAVSKALAARPGP